MTEIIEAKFDYSEISDRDYVLQKTGEIRDRMGRAALNIFEIGTRLLEVKSKLRHGSFGPWLSCEFGWSERTARSMMSVAENFKSATVADLDIAPTALYMLASPSTPPEVREEIVERAKAGEKIKTATVADLVEKRKPITAPITPNPEDIEPDPWDEPPQIEPREPTEADHRETHNAAINLAVTHLDADAKFISEAMGHVSAGGVHKLMNPESAKHSTWTGTVGVLKDAAKAVRGNLIVEHPENPGEYVSAMTAERIKRKAK